MVPQGLPLIGKVDKELAHRYRTVQPRRPGNSERHRAAGLRRARPPPLDLKGSQAGLVARAALGKLI